MERILRKINNEAKKIMDKLTEGLSKLGDYRKVKNNNTFMPVSVELIDYGQMEGEVIFSVAHYGTQNGDLMCDPEVVFMQLEGKYYPLTIRNDYSGYSSQTAEVICDRIVYNSRSQKDLAIFCGKWMKNIKYQQEI